MEGRGKPETFDFLGFTHICGTIHKSGKFTVHRKTVGKRMTAKLRSIRVGLRRRMLQPIAETGDWLRQVVRGYFRYHAVPGNLPRLEAFRQQIARHWRCTLRRRSQRRRWTWERFEILMARYLPNAARHFLRFRCIINAMGLQTVEIPVGGMTCGNCVRALERKLSTSPGVSTARVDLAGGTATVEFDADRTTLPDLLHAIAQLGYAVRQ